MIHTLRSRTRNDTGTITSSGHYLGVRPDIRPVNTGITLFKGSLSHFEVRASFRDQRYLGVVKTARNSLALMSRMEVRSEDISYVNDSVSIRTFRKLR